MMPLKKTSLSRLFFVLLAFLALGLAQRQAFGRSGYTLQADDVTVSVEGVITAYSRGTAHPHIVIPDQLGGVEITGIGPDAFKTKGLSSVVLPAGLASIGVNAFRDNILLSVDLSRCTELASIGTSAFFSQETSSGVLVSLDLSGCTKLTTIGENAFMDNHITSVTFPTGLITIGKNAFRANHIISVTFPTGLNSIGPGAFRWNQMSSLDLSGCTELTSIGADAFLEGGGKGSFFKWVDLSGCTSLTSIGARAFMSNRLVSVGLPTGDLAGYAPLWINGANEYIDGGAITDFDRSYRRASIYTLEAADVVLSGGVITSYSYLGDAPAPRYIVIPEQLGGQTITGIGPNAFHKKGLSSVVLPAGLASIGPGAFRWNQLASLDLSLCTGPVGST